MWELESSSEQSSDEEKEQEEEEEVEEILPTDVSMSSNQAMSNSFTRRDDDLLLANHLADTYSGAKARRIMGINMESSFDDWEENRSVDSFHPRAATTMRRNRSFKEAFSLHKYRGHHRAASLDNSLESESEGEQVDNAIRIRKRRPSISSVFGMSSNTSSSTSASPRMQSPLARSHSLSRGPPSISSKSSGQTMPSAKERSAAIEREEDEWNRELDQAAKAAKWQTSIGHRPKQDYSASVSADRPIVPEMEKAMYGVKYLGRNSGSGPALSPALTAHLTHMTASATQRYKERSASIGHDYKSHVVPHTSELQRRPSLPITPISTKIPFPSSSSKSSLKTPPSRPPRSSLREKRTHAVISPHATIEEDEMAAINSMEYMKRDHFYPKETTSSQGHWANPSPFSSLRSGSACSFQNDSSSSSLSSRSGNWRQSIGGISSVASEDMEHPSPSLSASSSSTHGSSMDVPLLIANEHRKFAGTDDNGRPISPFKKPRKAPTPPRLGLPFVHRPAGEEVSMRISKETEKPLPPRPLLIRCDSNVLDPDMSREAEHGGGADASISTRHDVASTYLHHTDRPTSIPFSPISAYSSHSMDYSREEEVADDLERDEFMTALDKLSSDLEMFSLPMTTSISIPHRSREPERKSVWAPRQLPFKSATAVSLRSRTSTNTSSSSSSISIGTPSNSSGDDAEDGLLGEAPFYDEHDDDAVHFFRIYNQ
ncbi:hypothetical protein CBS101457_005931 [Exobasidium rhododendri]|nr:hypothetical protein CBS101457_005931 [Exobasidium rhododendri]